MSIVCPTDTNPKRYAKNHEPIALVGTQRSGTTWMGRLFSQHPDLAYWVEPRHVWTWGNGYKQDDLLTESDASPRIVRHIRRTFDQFVQREGKQRLLEKTPSNCLRMRFVRAVYPEARLILILRDGRSVIRSTNEILNKGMPMARISQRARQTPIWEWPAYAKPALSAVARKMTGKRLTYWGPRPPGWREWAENDPVHIVLAKQWAATISRAMDDAEAMGPDQVMTCRYEDVLQNPGDTLARVAGFVGLSDAEPLVRYAEDSADPSRAEKWRAELDDETLEAVRPHMEPTLNRLGYTW